ncbi:hypothetical protein T01_6894 [Trichinella spiralis]|uniref:Uncharacterized protein n=1 Tax=Trichinella spiralis TaxID=6334 RepID=A0A0V1BCC1_TRISP|nr:hypothetical protein T01_6894 [Trichinella spiralis]
MLNEAPADGVPQLSWLSERLLVLVNSLFVAWLFLTLLRVKQAAVELLAADAYLVDFATFCHHRVVRKRASFVDCWKASCGCKVVSTRCNNLTNKF